MEYFMSEDILPDKRAKLKLYDEKCVVCVHLFPSCSKAKHYNKCHYKKGNEDCPASDIKFVVKPKIDKRAEAIVKKLNEGNVAKAIILLQRLVKQPQEEQKEILKHVKDKLIELGYEE